MSRLLQHKKATGYEESVTFYTLNKGYAQDKTGITAQKFCCYICKTYNMWLQKLVLL